jgi:saxitoxin biosynthesis operon SxtJ-like protein
VGRTFVHESNRDDEAASGSDRAFGLTVGGILVAIGALKVLLAAGALSVASAAMIAVGAVLLLLGVAAPALLALPHRLWLRLGAAIAAVANPVILALMFGLVVTPMAVLMRLAGKRPLQLDRDPGASSYWVVPDRSAEPHSSMRRQF